MAAPSLNPAVFNFFRVSSLSVGATGRNHLFDVIFRLIVVTMVEL
jgi:hypothetical protein